MSGDSGPHPGPDDDGATPAAPSSSSPSSSSLSSSPGDPGGEIADAAPLARTDAAAAALGRARAAAKEKGLVPGRRPKPRRRPLGTGPGFPEVRGRDPELIGSALSKMLTDRGWSGQVSVGSVLGRLREVVGEQVADHAEPETFVDGRLVVRASSTAWATQLQLLVPQLHRRLEEEVGPDVVTEIVVLGPGAPSWVRGPRVVRGRGPRDTYG